MTDGIEFQETAEAPQEKIEVADAHVDLDESTFEAPSKIEEGDVQAAEKTQAEFTSLVDSLPVADGRPKTEDRADVSPAPETADQPGDAGDAPIPPSAPQEGTPDSSGGKSDFGTELSPAVDSVEGDEPDEKSAAEVSISASEKQINSDDGTSVPDSDIVTLGSDEDDASGGGRTGLGGAPDLPPVDNGSGSEGVSPSTPPAEDSDSGLTPTGSSAQYNQGTASVNMQSAADQVASASDKLSGMDQALNAANEKLEAEDKTLAEAKETLLDHQSETKPARKPEETASRETHTTDGLVVNLVEEFATETVNIPPETTQVWDDVSNEFQAIDYSRGEDAQSPSASDSDRSSSKDSLGNPASDPTNNYSAVEMTQGMVALDSDWNQAAGESSPVGTGPEDPVPEGEAFETRDVTDLKKLLAPFRNNLGLLRELVADQQKAVGQDASRVEIDSSISGTIGFSEIQTIANADHTVIDTMLGTITDAEQDLGEIADKVSSSNDAKAGLREESSMLQNELEDWPDGKTREITFTTWEEGEDGNLMKVEKIVTLTKAETEYLVNQIEYQIEDPKYLEKFLDKDEAYQLTEGTIIVDEALSKAEKSQLRDCISTLREEVLTLQDELYFWPDGESRTITYREIDPNSLETKEITKSLTKDEAKALIAKWENMMNALETRLEEGSDIQLDNNTYQYLEVK